ncbi:protein BREVIS RADIX [Cajanus cajan]|uniref:protein BREVIS RADIX n=1 Tax=Cajanus cajan TaxID=3821 RepID=UPI00098D7D74|nr:protein BREVIS RADIX [Cajanus cajan]
MFPCISCTKQTAEDEEEGGESGTPSTKEAVKSLSSQLKDMALKFSGAYKQCKPCTGSSSFKKGQRPFPDFDTVSDGVPYPYIGGVNSTSTPKWDLSSNFTGGSQRFMGGFSGDRTPRVPEAAPAPDVVVQDQEENQEWVAQVEPGISITFVTLPNGANDLKRIRFSRDIFDRWQAQKWWTENYERISELYNVHRYNQQDQNTTTPSRSDQDEITSFEQPRDSSVSRLTFSQENPVIPSMAKDWTPMNQGGGGQNLNAGSSVEASRTTTSSRDEASMSNASEMEAEWVEQDEPGVYITIKQSADGTKELRRVRFSRERFGEGHAKKWWEDNRERIQAQYL